MDDTIQIRRGAKGARESLPALSVGEPGFCTDVEGGALYIGSTGGNVLIGSGERSAKAVRTCGAMPDLTTTATLADVITAYNNLLSTLRTAGLMEVNT